MTIETSLGQDERTNSASPLEDMFATFHSRIASGLMDLKVKVQAELDSRVREVDALNARVQALQQEMYDLQKETRSESSDSAPA